MRTIAVVNQKGGCGKTTVSINLASALAELGQRTLLVDMDPQAHCAVGLAVPEEQIEQSIYDVLISKSRNEPIKLTEILWQIGDNLEMAPASIDLSAFEQQMTGVSERECCLKNVLDEIKEFDYVIIDCPPAVGLLTFNALRASTDVVVPVETGYFSLHGLSKQLETLNILCERCSQEVNVGVLASMYDVRTKMAREILAELRSHFGDKMFKTMVNFNTKLKEAASFGQPISEYDPASKGQKDFRALAQEVIDSEIKQERHEFVNTLSSQLDARWGSTADELLQSIKPAIKTIEPFKIEKSKPAVQTVESPRAQVPRPAIQSIEVGKAETAEPVLQTAQAGKAETVQPSQQAAEWPKAATSQAVMETAVEAEVETAEPTIEPVETADEPEEAPPVDIDTKLSDFYGVSQINDAMVFVTLYPRAESVQLAGDFNNWQPTETKLQKVGQSGVWQTKLKLPAGKYRYRVVVDGQWQQDPYNEHTELNPFGEYNSIVEVK